MDEALMPCPFCGGEAREFTGEDAAPHRWTVECDCCGAHVGSDTRHRARAKWNRRAERTCRMQFDDWEYRYRCSRCGCLSEAYRGTDGKLYAPEYCTSCGAKVVSE